MHRLMSVVLMAAVIGAEPAALAAEVGRDAGPADGLAIATGHEQEGAWTSLDRLRGSSVRVRQASGMDITGQLTSTSADTLVVALRQGPRSVNKTDICEVIVRERNQSRAIGWIVGLGLGGLVFGIVNTHVNEGAQNPALYAAIGGGLGALIGASPHERTVFRDASLCTKSGLTP